MTRKEGAALLKRAAAVRRRIEHWRKTREKRTAMPEELWESAAALAAEWGVYPIARSVGVDYDSLRKRVRQVAAEQKTETEPRDEGGFVELSASQLLGPQDQHGAVMELSTADGATLQIRMPPGQPVDVLGLAGTLCRRGA